MKCEITNKSLKEIINFGKMPLGNGFLKKNEFSKEFFYEMKVGFSENISLFRLYNFPLPKIMFNSQYPFYTSSSKFMIEHFKKFSSFIINNYLKNLNNPFVIEIGSNDGTLLKNFLNLNIKHLGFEPSKNVFNFSKKNKGISVVNNFFNYQNIKNFKCKNVDVIIGANVICHIPDLIDLFKSIDFCLSKKGIFIFEEPYLGSMYKNVSYDQIYDEHIYIFSVNSIKKIANIFNMELIDTYPQLTHGGSMRYVVSRKKEYKISSRVNKILKYESLNSINTVEGALKFATNCLNSRNNILNKINKIKNQKKKICGYGATSKSTTVLNFCNINQDLIDCIFDTTKEKIGKYSPGMHIPIKDYNKFYDSNFKVAYLFAWNHKNEIIQKEKNFFKNGGKWISHVNL